MSRLLAFAIFSLALALLACEVSIAYKIPWLDPRPALVKVQRFAVAKVSKLRGR